MLLAIDTSTTQIGVALYNGTDVPSEKTWLSKVNHSIELAPAVAELLTTTGTSMEAIECLGVAIGPGSFTALRVGLAFAKGLSLARKIPMVGVPTLHVLASGQRASELPLAAVLRAGRGRIAVSWYSFDEPTRSGENPASRIANGGWRHVEGPEVMTADDLAKAISRRTLVAGELTDEERQRLARKRVKVVLAAPQDCIRQPGILAALAWERYRAGKTDDPSSLAPLYLHSGDPVAA